MCRPFARSQFRNVVSLLPNDNNCKSSYQTRSCSQTAAYQMIGRYFVRLSSSTEAHGYDLLIFSSALRRPRESRNTLLSVPDHPHPPPEHSGRGGSLRSLCHSNSLACQIVSCPSQPHRESKIEKGQDKFHLAEPFFPFLFFFFFFFALRLLASQWPLGPALLMADPLTETSCNRAGLRRGRACNPRNYGSMMRDKLQ